MSLWKYHKLGLGFTSCSKAGLKNIQNLKLNIVTKMIKIEYLFCNAKTDFLTRKVYPA